MSPLASYSQGAAYSPDQLFLDPPPKVSRKITLVSGENRSRGGVLGRIAGAVTAAAAAGNTGNGTFAATPTVGAGVKEGVYQLVIIEPATDAGKFQLEDPDGNIVGTGTVAVAFSGPLAFTLQDGGTDFVAGDRFTITVAAGTKYKLAATAATDGSQTPDCILAEDCDASGGDKEAIAYFDGHFNEGALTFGTGHTADTVRATLRDKGIQLSKAQEA